MKQNETILQRFGTKLQQNETKSGIFYKNMCYDNSMEFEKGIAKVVIFFCFKNILNIGEKNGENNKKYAACGNFKVNTLYQ